MLVFTARLGGGDWNLLRRPTSASGQEQLLSNQGREHVPGSDVLGEPVDPVLMANSDRHLDTFTQRHDRERWNDGYLCLRRRRG